MAKVYVGKTDIAEVPDAVDKKGSLLHDLFWKGVGAGWQAKCLRSYVTVKQETTEEEEDNSQDLKKKIERLQEENDELRGFQTKTATNIAETIYSEISKIGDLVRVAVSKYDPHNPHDPDNKDDVITLEIHLNTIVGSDNFDAIYDVFDGRF